MMVRLRCGMTRITCVWQCSARHRSYLTITATCTASSTPITDLSSAGSDASASRLYARESGDPFSATLTEPESSPGG